MFRLVRTMSIITTVVFEDDVHEHMKSNMEIDSASGWINETYKKYFMTRESKIKKLDFHAKYAEKLKDELKKDKEEENNLKKLLSEREIQWLKNEAPGRLKRGSVEGIYRFYCADIRNKFDINRRQFRIIFEKVNGYSLPKGKK